MYKKTCTANRVGADDEVGYVETDPSGRYGRFRETLGKGAMKTVYRAFDEVLGMEVAWNQVKLNDVFHSEDALHRLYSEVHLLKNLNHDTIIQYHTSWIDVTRRTFNFITEMFTSGTLREYRQKYHRIDMGVIKRWARQILSGLVYLHGHDPPVIHRDLKCDNIFVNGHCGQIKIGDLGLAATLHQSRHAHSVLGTPEFMAPELYDEDYNELVDIYAFGMCVLEMLTCEYPYSECFNPAQIYKKVTSGKLPEAFYKIRDKEARQFVRKCLENVAQRLSATDLLLDPFLRPDEGDEVPLSRAPSNGNLTPRVAVVEQPQVLEADSERATDMSITGTMNSKDDTVFLKFQISDKDGHVRNIQFPFNIMNDTSIEVALEMVKELDITDWEPLEIAEMIEKEISSLVPDWMEHSTSNANHHQPSFNFKDEDDYEDDERLHHPFYNSNSSGSTSQGTSPASYDSGFCSGSKAAINLSYIKAFVLLHSQNSKTHSEAPSKQEYPIRSCDTNDNNCGENEKDSDGMAGEIRGLGNSLTNILKIHEEATGPCPGNSRDGRRQQPRLPRLSSLVDMRTQVLHRSMTELIKKRLTLKTVGSLQNINDVHDMSVINGKSKSRKSRR